MSKKLGFVCVFFFVFMSLAVNSTASQVTTADVRGHVSDPNGLAVGNAKVTITSKETASTRDTMTSDLGDYALNQLPPGVYKVTVTKDGFATIVFDPVELAVGQKLTLDAALKLGSGSEVVQVTEETLSSNHPPRKSRAQSLRLKCKTCRWWTAILLV